MELATDSWKKTLCGHVLGSSYQNGPWNTIGDFLACSGWISALCEAGVATSEIADAFLKAAHLTRTRRSHQITALTLTRLREHDWEIAAWEEESLNFET